MELLRKKRRSRKRKAPQANQIWLDRQLSELSEASSKRRKVTKATSKKFKSATARKSKTNSPRRRVPLRKKAPKTISPKPKRKDDRARKVFEKEIEEIRCNRQKCIDKKENQLTALEKAEKKAIQEIKAKYKREKAKYLRDSNIDINARTNDLNTSINMFEENEENEEIFCRICFEAADEELHHCKKCDIACCDCVDCYVSCDRDGCEVGYCESHKDLLKTMCCEYCSFCPDCKIYDHDRHKPHCLQ